MSGLKAKFLEIIIKLSLPDIVRSNHVFYFFQVTFQSPDKPVKVATPSKPAETTNLDDQENRLNQDVIVTKLEDASSEDAVQGLVDDLADLLLIEQ